MSTFALRAQQVKSVPPIGVSFAAVPLDVMRRPDLTPAAKLVFAALANHARMKRGDSSNWTNAQIASAVGMTPSGVRRPLDELAAVGLIERRYGESERVRASIRIVYGPSQVGAPASTQPAAVAPEQQPGCDPSAPRVGAPASSPNTKNREPGENVVPLSTHGGGEPKPTPQEIAEAMRAMIGGRYAPALFDADKPTAAAPPAPGQQDLDPRRLFKQVGYSARAAIVQSGPPRKSQAQQLAELAATRHRRESSPSPAPIRPERSTVGMVHPTGP